MVYPTYKKVGYVKLFLRNIFNNGNMMARVYLMLCNGTASHIRVNEIAGICYDIYPRLPLYTIERNTVMDFNYTHSVSGVNYLIKINLRTGIVPDKYNKDEYTSLSSIRTTSRG
jgi:hypothetical protein